MKAATQLQLNVLASNDPKVAEIAARLPVGRVHVTGRTFVPFIRRDLYDKLVAATAAEIPTLQTRPTGLQRRQVRRPAGRRPICHKTGNRLASAISSSRMKIERTAGTRPSLSRQTATCSHYAGVTTREYAGLCAIGCNSGYSTRGPD